MRSSRGELEGSAPRIKKPHRFPLTVSQLTTLTVSIAYHLISLLPFLIDDCCNHSLLSVSSHVTSKISSVRVFSASLALEQNFQSTKGSLLVYGYSRLQPEFIAKTRSCSIGLYDQPPRGFSAQFSATSYCLHLYFFIARFVQPHQSCTYASGRSCLTLVATHSEDRSRQQLHTSGTLFYIHHGTSLLTMHSIL
jgi:hypothetical protein